MTTPIDISPEAVERWHEELSGMVAGKALYKGQKEYVLASDFYAVCAALTAEQEELRRTQDELRRIGFALTASQAAGMCDACAGTGTPVSGAPCMCGGSGRAADAVHYLRLQLTASEKQVAAGKALWDHLVKTRQAWGEDQDVYVEMGLLKETDMTGEDESERCDDCDDDCATCYRTTELLR